MKLRRRILIKGKFNSRDDSVSGLTLHSTLLLHINNTVGKSPAAAHYRRTALLRRALRSVSSPDQSKRQLTMYTVLRRLWTES